MMFAKYLCKKDWVARVDVTIFHMWETGVINTKTALEKWLDNNDVDKETLLLESFEIWLNSLGYYNEDTQKYMPTGCYKV